VIKLSDILLDWFQNTPISFREQVNYSGVAFFSSMGFRCNGCPKYGILADVNDDNIEVWDQHYTGKTTNTVLRAEDPRFFTKLERILLRERKRCCG
jgi:hypothetical protein